jgi:hypothetical protein
MDFNSKEFDFTENAKMFALGAQGIWFDFAGGGVLTRHGRVAAGIWQWLLEHEAARLKREGKVVESWYQIRKRLMGLVEKKIEERDREDLLTILTA